MIGRNRDPGDSAAIVFPSFENAVESADLNRPLLVTGQVYDDRSVWQLRGLVDETEISDVATAGENEAVIGVCLPEGHSEEGTESVSSYGIDDPPKVLDGPHVQVEVDADAETGIETVLSNPETEARERLNVETVEMDRLFIRVEHDEMTPLDELREKKVAFVGLGSGGGLIASYLAKAGVKNLVFIDDDIYETHNVVRHVCGMDALGRKKVDAMEEYIHRRLPDVDIETYDRKFDLRTREDKDFFRDVFGDVDLILAAAAEQPVNLQLDTFVLSELDAEIPIMFAGMFEGLAGGIMIRADPREDDPCYHCIYSKQRRRGGRDAAETGRNDDSGIEHSVAMERSHGSDQPSPGAADADVPYNRDQEDEASEPGLGLDVDNLSIFAAKMALSTLIKGTDHGLYEMSRNIYVWANRDMVQGAFDPSDPDIQLWGLELTYPTEDQIPRRESCPRCGIPE